MPRYKPDEATEPNPLFQKGVYSAVVKRATEEVSKSGNDMIKLILTCYGADNTETDVFDYLVFTPGMLYKVRHFCESAGINFDKGDLTAEECQDQNIQVELKIEKGEGTYRDKNVVNDYVGKSAAKRGAVPTGAGPVKAGARAADPDLPF